MTTENIDIARKSYRTSLRAKLKRQYSREAEQGMNQDRRWVNGFMAAGFHSGLMSLQQLKVECATAFKYANGRKMTDAEDVRLEQRLARLCADA